MRQGCLSGLVTANGVREVAPTTQLQHHEQAPGPRVWIEAAPDAEKLRNVRILFDGGD